MLINLILFCVVLARTSSIKLNRKRGSGHICFVPDLRGKGFTFWPLSILVEFFVDVLLSDWESCFVFCLVDRILKKFLLLFNYSCMPFLPIPPPHPRGFFFFNHERMLHFGKCFSCIYGNEHMVFIFYSVDMVNYIIWLILNIKLTSNCWDVIIWFCYQDNAGPIEWVRKRCLLNSLEEFDKDWY